MTGTSDVNQAFCAPMRWLYRTTIKYVTIPTKIRRVQLVSHFLSNSTLVLRCLSLAISSSVFMSALYHILTFES